MNQIKKLITIWWKLSLAVAQKQLITTWGGVAFLLGKIIRFVLLLVFLLSVVGNTNSLAGYTRDQVVFFFLMFNLVDALVQFLYRGVYVFRPLVVQGKFDLDLLKPLPSYFRPIFGWTDILDFITLIPLWIYIVYFVFSRGLFTSPFDLLLFAALLVNSLVIGFAFHLFISAVCVMTTEIDHLTWIYRDITSMARFPTDIYAPAIRYALTFTIPVVVLITVPAKALLGLLTPQTILLAFGITLVFLLGSLKFWNYAISQYTSASS